MNPPAHGYYERLVRPLLFQLDPETAHHCALGFLRALARVPGGLAFLRTFAPPPRPRMLFGLQFRNPVGLAAGFDKNGVAIAAWEALGFGFVEIGTVTARPQPGNPLPRIFRYPEQEVLINRLGFNNDGAAVIAERLERLRAGKLAPSVPVGVNLGKSRATPVEDASADYLESFRILAPVADYMVLNVSSPNTPGLRDLQEEKALERLLRAVMEENDRFPKPRPVLLKIAPDLSAQALEPIVRNCEALGLAGLIATNTTLDHSGLRGKDEPGGLSGSLLCARSTDVIRQLRSLTALPIIGVGGICDGASAREKEEAGADLIQLYTGYVFRGPGLVREVGKALGRS
jgi:dihydroorotate dehydrogenase